MGASKSLLMCGCLVADMEGVGVVPLVRRTIVTLRLIIMFLVSWNKILLGTIWITFLK